MRAFHYLSVGLCVMGMHAANVAAVPVHYVSSGVLDHVYDQNSLLELFGEQPVYPQGIAPGTSFSVSMTLDGNLEMLSGFVEFDIGGIYQGHMSVGGGGTACSIGVCGHYESELPWLDSVSFGGESGSAATNLPVAYLNNGKWSFGFGLVLPPHTPKPSANTPLTDLPVTSMHLSLWSGYSGSRIGPCPAGFESMCGTEGVAMYNISQGWSIDGTATTLAEVPLPIAAWMFGSGMIGLIGARICKSRAARR